MPWMVDIGFAYDHPHLHNYHVPRYCHDTGFPLFPVLSWFILLKLCSGIYPIYLSLFNDTHKLNCLRIYIQILILYNIPDIKEDVLKWHLQVGNRAWLSSWGTVRRKGQIQIRPHKNGDRPNLNHHASFLHYLLTNWLLVANIRIYFFNNLIKRVVRWWKTCLVVVCWIPVTFFGV